VQRTDDANGYLTAIGYEDTGEHGLSLGQCGERQISGSSGRSKLSRS
jgi:hypothetical protein